MHRFESLNLELTTKCPLRCPQCYCTLEGGIDLPMQTAVRIIREAALLGAKHIELSGGETLCYPWLPDLLRESKANGILPNIAISGWHFDHKTADLLINAGVGGIFVSLNAPESQKNLLTREGFDLAVQALKVLASSGYSEFYINWVMHRSTADSLLAMIEFVRPFHPKGIVIMSPKPDASHRFDTFPTAQQMASVVQTIRHNKSGVGLFVESCFSPLLALLGKNPRWVNFNRGISKGCSAGLTSVSVNVCGLFSPCRHLEVYESYDSLKEYWEDSKTLERIRLLKDHSSAHCLGCSLSEFCRPCMAVDTKLRDTLTIDNVQCPLAENDPNSV